MGDLDRREIGLDTLYFVVDGVRYPVVAKASDWPEPVQLGKTKDWSFDRLMEEMGAE